MSKFTILYASDLHGSNVCFAKLITTAREIDPSVVIIGGDLSGKSAVPVGDVGNNAYTYAASDGAEQRISSAELQILKREWADRGLYYFVVPNEKRLQMSEQERLAVERDLIKVRLQKWSDYAASILRPRGIRLILIPGNDDPKDINEDLSRAEWTENVDEKYIVVDSYPVAGFGYSNPTPWNCPRELPELDIARRLAAVCSSLKTEDYARLILICHVPPYRSGLDVAPEIETKNGEFVLVQGGEREVGSTSVRKFVDDRQPLLVLSGHCHDSPGFRFIGRSLCVNAGSSYSVGVLRAALLTLEQSAVAGYQQLIR